MPYYRVSLEAQGIEVLDVDGGSPIIGFFTTRIVRADSTSEAAERAMAMVLADWTTGEHAALNRGSRPVLTVDSIHPSNWLQHLRFKNHGHAFFTDEEVDD